MSTVLTTDEFHAAMNEDTVRVTFAPTISFTSGMVHTARVEVKQPNGRWKRIDPLILPREGGDRADLLDALASLTRGPQ